MDFLTVNYETQESILKSFDAIANKISKDIILKINNANYRIVDFEFYTFSEKKFSDPHTYKHDLQLQNCKLYLHSSGIDITFGDGVNYGGILLRSVIKLHDGSTQESGFMKEQFNGPQIVATELFSNFNALDGNEKNEISIIDIQGHHQDTQFYPAIDLIKTKRVGLTPKSNDKDDFYKKLQLRYIAILPKFPVFKQNLKGIEGILGEKVIAGEITASKATEISIKILGYRKNYDGL